MCSTPSFNHKPLYQTFLWGKGAGEIEKGKKAIVVGVSKPHLGLV